MPVGATATQTLNLYNTSSTTAINISNFQIQGHQFQAGFLTTIGGFAPGQTGGIDPKTLNGGAAPFFALTLNKPAGVLIDSSPGGHTFIVDTGDNLILMVDAQSGNAIVIAGGGSSGTADGVPAASATLNGPTAIIRDPGLNLYFADTGNYLVRMVTSPVIPFAPPPTIKTVAGNGSPCKDPTAACATVTLGEPATNVSLGTVLGVGFDHIGYLYISDADLCRILKIDLTSTSSSTYGDVVGVLGSGTCGYAGDGAAATMATFNHPAGIRVDQLTNIFVADTGNNVVRRVDGITGITTTFAGNGSNFYASDFVPATSTGLPGPNAVTVDYKGNVFITCGNRPGGVSPAGDSTVRRVDAVTGLISTVAGMSPTDPTMPNIGYSPDSLGALTELSNPQDATVDSAGNLFIMDADNNLYRRVDFTTVNTASEFVVTNNSCVGSLAAGTSCPVTMAMTPAMGDVRTAQLIFTTNGQPNSMAIPLYGFGRYSYIRASASNVILPETKVSSESWPPTQVNFANTGNMVMTTPTLAVTNGTPSGNFVETDNCATWTGSPYYYCSAFLNFAPPSTGSTLTNYTAAISFASNAMNSPATVNLSGTGVVQQSPNITWKPAPLVYGTPLGPKQLNIVATDPVTSQIVPGTFNYSPAATTVLTPGPTTLTAYFVPADPVAYAQEGASILFTVGPAPLTVTANSSTITNAGPINLTSTITGVVGSDVLNVTYTSNPPLPSGPPFATGVYTITPQAGTGPWSYYAPVFKNGTLTIGTPMPDLAVTSLSVPSAVTAGATVSVGDTTTDIGTAPAGSTSTAFYLSTNPTTNNKWMYLGNRAIASLGIGAANASIGNTSLVFPASVTGSYTFFACANAYNTVAESNTTNNCMKAAITINTGVDLVVSSLSYAPLTPVLGGQLQVTDTTANVGTGTSGSSSTTFYLATFSSTGTLLNAKWMYLGNRGVGALTSGSPSTATTTFTLPTTLNGTYGVTACANAYKSTLENNYNNNCTTTTTTFKLP